MILGVKKTISKGCGMQLCCTKKVLDYLKVQPEAVEFVDPLFSWHVNMFILCRKKALLLVNDLSRYPILLFGIKKADVRNFNELILNSISMQLTGAGFGQARVAEYISRSGNVSILKTHNRAVLSHCSQMAFLAGYEVEDLFFDELLQPVFSERAASLIYKIETGNGRDYYRPRDLMAEGLGLLVR